MAFATSLPSRFDQLIALQDVVFQEWMKRVRAQVSRARNLASPLLVDTLPILYKHLATLATGETSTYDRSTLASAHGGERARLTSMDAQSVAHELHLFRNTALEFWENAGIRLSADEAAKVNTAVDMAIRDAIAGYVLAQTAFREQFFAALTHDLRTPLSTGGMAVLTTEVLRRIEQL